jgi:hypothetical protein
VRNKKIRSWLLLITIAGGAVAGALIGNAIATDDGGINGAANKGAGILFGGILGGESAR